MTKLSNNVSVVIPVYNSEAALPQLVNRIHSVLQSCASDYELILINDGSRDKSWEVICELARQYACIRGINCTRNYGQHNALLCGIRAATGEVIITMDDDLQHPPEAIQALLASLAEGYDVVYGSPKEEQHGFFRDVASKITKIALQSAMSADIARSVSAFRAFRTRLRDAFADYQSPFVSVDVLLTWGTTRFTSICVPHEPRKIGKSNYTFRKLLTHALNMMTGYSILPLQFASLMGLGLTFFGMLLLIYVLGRYLLQGSSVPGFPFLASTIIIFSGAQLLALGIIGEYLARIHFRSMGCPSYVIRDECGRAESQTNLQRREP
ncbi:MAG TPA: glycosyltransferase family 2 protein [Syntrophorhabdales bacterium]|nr:glycosyltransferase family 2 protein [Syntrophorhabdales bacterium]